MNNTRREIVLGYQLVDHPPASEQREWDGENQQYSVGLNLADHHIYMKNRLRTILVSSRFSVILIVISVSIWLLGGVLLGGNLGWFNPDAIPRLSPMPRVLVDTLAAALALIAIPGAWLLWAAMLLYWKDFDSSPKYKKRLWFLVIVFGFCYGASIYFFVKLRSLKSLSARA